ncbi:hypothetical protein N7494_012835 [Penicillium frequentans]|uniref:LysM domain-containing protein n=1 Tax=Penicillium frequentans TaxID=3151616 RepID=A0AAD6CP06_9EURO|nr:hypothetical protein N7494_012835 [Penicillium glabrum]
MKYTLISRFLAFGAILASTATAAYFPGGLLSAEYTSFDKRTIPTADSDGICYTYTVEAGDTCASIAKAFDITVAEIEKHNSDVYAWYGCDDVYQGAFICLSTGSPTMPVALPHAICGPQVPGTVRPANMSKSNLASLKPCASNHCHNLHEIDHHFVEVYKYDIHQVIDFINERERNINQYNFSGLVNRNVVNLNI